MNILRKYKYDVAIFLVLAAVVSFLVALRGQFGFLEDRGSFEQFIKGFGAWGPFVIILTIILEVVIAPLPGFVPAISAGFIFGALQGSIYTYVGNVLGSLLVFWLSRRYGRMILEKFTESTKIKKYENMIAKRENILLFAYVFPILPVDIISGAFGLSKIRFKKFALAVAIGFVFHVVILNLFGDYLARLYFMI